MKNGFLERIQNDPTAMMVLAVIIVLLGGLLAMQIVKSGYEDRN